LQPGIAAGYSLAAVKPVEVCGGTQNASVQIHVAMNPFRRGKVF
jgi:hypothetical protein